MTKKDYKLIASVIAEQAKFPSSTAEMRSLAIRMSSALRDDNSRFDMHRFLLACEVGVSETQ